MHDADERTRASARACTRSRSRAIDLKGNVDPTPAVRTWTIDVPPIDVTPPDTPIDSGPDPITVLTDRDVHVLERGPGRDVRVPAGPARAERRVGAVHVAEVVQRHPGRRRARSRSGRPTGRATPTRRRRSTRGRRLGARARLRLLRPGDHDEHQGPQRPGRLPVGRPRRRRRRHHDRPRRPHDRRQGHRRRHPQRRLRQRHDQERQDPSSSTGASCSTPAPRRTSSSSCRSRQSQEAGIGLGHPPHPTDPLLPLPPPPPSSFDSKVLGNILRFNTIVANDIGIWLAYKTKDTLILENEINANPAEGVFHRALERQPDREQHDLRLERVGRPDGGLEQQHGAVRTTCPRTAAACASTSRAPARSASRPTTTGSRRTRILEPAGAALEIIESDGTSCSTTSPTSANGEGISLYRARRQRPARQRRQHQQDRHRAGHLERQPPRGQQRERLRQHRHLGRVAVAEQHAAEERVVATTTATASTSATRRPAAPARGSRATRSTTTRASASTSPRSATSIKANLANDNGGWGIWASEGSNGRHNIDGGGNKAQGNHGPLDPITLKPLQCYTIVCTGVDVPSSDIIAPGTQLLEAPRRTRARPPSRRFRFDGSDNASPTVDVPVPARRRNWAPWGPCSSPAVVHAAGRQPHVRGARRRRGRERRPDARRRTRGGSTRRRRRRPTSTITSGPDPTTVATDARSSSRRTPQARRSSASSTPARSRPAPRRRSTRARSPSARTRSRCARSSRRRRGRRRPHLARAAGRRSRARCRAARSCSRASG